MAEGPYKTTPFGCSEKTETVSFLKKVTPFLSSLSGLRAVNCEALEASTPYFGHSSKGQYPKIVTSHFIIGGIIY